jgi:hypothetical protein
MSFHIGFNEISFVIIINIPSKMIDYYVIIAKQNNTGRTIFIKKYANFMVMVQIYNQTL